MIDTTKSICISLQRHVSTLTGGQHAKMHVFKTYKGTLTAR